jgi:DNA polymerase-3 subunit gamma/tau
MRDALSLLDQCAAVSDSIEAETVEEAVGVAGTESVFEILNAIADRNAAAALERIDLLYQQSKDMTRFADEISQELRSLMLLKTAPDDPALLDCMPAELEQLRALAGRYSMAAVLETLSSVRQCCDRMTRAGNRRMELEMTLIRLCTDLSGQTQQGDSGALTERVKALEEQLAALQAGGFTPQQARRALARREPAQNLQVESKTDTSQFKPVKNWLTILERFNDVNPSVSGLLQGSEAYVIEEKNLLLMVVRNRLFRKLFTKQDAVSLGTIAAQILGKQYSIRYKCAESEADKTAPADALLARADAEGITVAQQEGTV